MTDQRGLFVVQVVHHSEEGYRPETGYMILDNSPSGFVSIPTQRTGYTKFADFQKALEWVRSERPGYSIEVHVEGFKGVLVNHS